MMQREVVIVSGVRTAIGTFGGSLKDFSPTELAARVVRESLSRAGVVGDEVGQTVFGNVIQTESKDSYLARVAAISGGVGEHVPALTVNRLCGSGLQALISAAQTILLGDADIVIGDESRRAGRRPMREAGSGADHLAASPAAHYQGTARRSPRPVVALASATAQFAVYDQSPIHPWGDESYHDRC